MTPKTAIKAPKTKKTKKTATTRRIEYINPRQLRPSLENEQIYNPIRDDDPQTQSLLEDILENGVEEAIIISLDNFIISGHRRHRCSLLAKLKVVPCVRKNVERGGDECDEPSSEFMKMLVRHNKQRIKSRSEQLRETLVDISIEDAYGELESFRWEQQKKTSPEKVFVKERGKRPKISKAKGQMAEAVIRVIEENREFWPLSVRRVHYELLNLKLLKNTKDPDSFYLNDDLSYKNLSKLLVRLRVNCGRVPHCAIGDRTRPTVEWDTNKSVQQYLKSEIENIFKSYKRNLMQSQPKHIEIVGEKMTIESIIRPVCNKYTLPYTILRGFSSLSAEYEIAKRFRRSGKDGLVVIALTDFDPDGLALAESVMQTLKEDFHIYFSEMYRAGIEPKHVKRFRLARKEVKGDSQELGQMKAKESSSRYESFVARYGDCDIYEMEALRPKELQAILEETIQNVIDRDAFEAELAAEKQDAHFLAGVRRQVVESVRGILIEGQENCPESTNDEVDNDSPTG